MTGAPTTVGTVENMGAAMVATEAAMVATGAAMVATGAAMVATGAAMVDMEEEAGITVRVM